jgi:hypothetical protein
VYFLLHTVNWAASSQFDMLCFYHYQVKVFSAFPCDFLTHGLYRSVSFNFQVIGDFSYFYISNLLLFWLKKIILIFWSHRALIYSLSYNLASQTLCVHLNECAPTVVYLNHIDQFCSNLQGLKWFLPSSISFWEKDVIVSK